MIEVAHIERENEPQPDEFGRYMYHIRIDMQTLLFYVDPHPKLGKNGRYSDANQIPKDAIKHMTVRRSKNPNPQKAEIISSHKSSVFVLATEEIANEIEAIIHDVATVQKVRKNPTIID